MSVYNSLPLIVSTEIPVPINIQLKEQIKYLLIKEVLKSGDYLPTVSQLADQLAINRNTINWVYTQLKDDGYLQMSKGRRTQISGSSQLKELSKHDTLHTIVESAINEASTKGYQFEEFITSTVMHHHLFIQAGNHPSYLFIECKEHDYPFYSEEIKKHIGVEVSHLFIEDVKDEELFLSKVASTDGIITTLNHTDEVHKLCKPYGKPIYTIGATIDLASLLPFTQLNPGTKVGFVCLGKKGGEWMAERVKEAGITHISPIIAGINEDNGLEMLSDADQIFASAAVYHSIKENNPEKTHLLPFKLEQTSRNLLQNIH